MHPHIDELPSSLLAPFTWKNIIIISSINKLYPQCVLRVNFCIFGANVDLEPEEGNKGSEVGELSVRNAVCRRRRVFSSFFLSSFVVVRFTQKINLFISFTKYR
jgi:hypothetical protein